MMNLRLAASGATFAAALFTASIASAQSTSYSDPTAFHALGANTQTTTWPGYPEADFTVLGPSYTDGALTFTGQTLAVFGKNYPTYMPHENVLSDNFIGPLHVDVTQPGSNLLSFELANMIGSRDFTLRLNFFNGSGDDFNAFGEGAISASEGFQFYGFALPTGMYFTSFEIESNNTPQDLANDQATFIGLYKVELGHTGSPIGGGGCRDTSVACTGGVPEPASWALMILGFGAVGATLRRRAYRQPQGPCPAG